MSKRPRALIVAEAIQDRRDWYEFDASAWCPEAAALLRSQHELIGELAGALSELDWEFTKPPALMPPAIFKARAALLKAKEQQ